MEIVQNTLFPLPFVIGIFIHLFVGSNLPICTPKYFVVHLLPITYISPIEASLPFLSDRSLFSEIKCWRRRNFLSRNWCLMRPRISERIQEPATLLGANWPLFRELSTTREHLFFIFFLLDLFGFRRLSLYKNLVALVTFDYIIYPFILMEAAYFPNRLPIQSFIMYTHYYL